MKKIHVLFIFLTLTLSSCSSVVDFKRVPAELLHRSDDQKSLERDRILRKIETIIEKKSDIKELEEQIEELKSLTSKKEAQNILKKLFRKYPKIGHKSIYFSFDWDDNIFFSTTKIIVYEKSSGAEKEISTEEWAKVKHKIGMAGSKFSNYEIREGSFRYFGSGEDFEKRFIDDLVATLDGKSDVWKGPVWEEFVRACSNKVTAERTSIITARGHNRETIHRALKELKKRGLIKFIPPVKNIWTVTSDKFADNFRDSFGREIISGLVNDPSQAKVEVMKEVLDDISAKKFTKKEAKFLSPEGRSYGNYHLWGFSDDDYDNFKRAKDFLQRKLDEGAWENVKITLIYTGDHRPDIKQKAIVLRSNMRPRPARIMETVEWQRAISKTKLRTNEKCAAAISPFL